MFESIAPEAIDKPCRTLAEQRDEIGRQRALLAMRKADIAEMGAVVLASVSAIIESQALLAKAERLA